MQLTNEHGIPLNLAVWLLHDDYDYVDDEQYISVTSLMKPLRQIVLPKRSKSDRVMDISALIASSMGSAIHAGIELAWSKGYKKPLYMLGYPKSVVESIVINPEGPVLEDQIPVYMERRTIREINGFKIGGKFDWVAEGRVEDFKSTSVYTYLLGGKDEDYILQGSLYRWLNPDIITDDVMRINYIFTDWKKLDAKKNADYPQCRITYKDYPLMSLEETEKWIINKLNQVMKYKDVPEKDIPKCTDKELWRGQTLYKFYLDPNKTARATKVSEDLAELRAYQVEKGGRGVIHTVPGVPKRCEYCNAYELCTQKDEYE